MTGSIYTEGSFCDKLYFIKAGEITITKQIIKTIKKENTLQELLEDPSVGR